MRLRLTQGMLAAKETTDFMLCNRCMWYILKFESTFHDCKAKASPNLDPTVLHSEGCPM